MKYLIVGLGNIGDEYAHTRHNIGFDTLDAFAKASNVVFEDHHYGFTAEYRLRGHDLLLLKPSTFMNLSGNAVRYWLQKAKVDDDHLLVVVDDVALPVGALRLKSAGSAGGHNGLRNIEEVLGTQQYARLRFGIGNHYPRGGQIDYVLGRFDPEERMQIVEPRIAQALEIIRSFCLAGIQVTMNQFNNK